MDQPLVTVTVSSYRKFGHILEAFDSIFMQDYPHIQLLIADDGSANYPAQAIRDYVESHKTDRITEVLYLHSAENVGTVKNMNAAHRLAGGDYLLDLDADDAFFAPDTVSRIVQTFMTSGADLLVTTCLFCREESDRDHPDSFLPHISDRKRILRLDTPEKCYSALLKGLHYRMMTGAALYFSKKILWEMEYFDETYRLLEDGPFFFRYAFSHKIGFAHDIISIRYRDGGISSKGHAVTPAYEADLARFRDVEMFEHYESLDRRTKRYLRYFREKTHLTSRAKLPLLYLRYFPITVRKFCYNLHEKIALLEDKLFVRRRKDDFPSVKKKGISS